MQQGEYWEIYQPQKNVIAFDANCSANLRASAFRLWVVRTIRGLGLLPVLRVSSDKNRNNRGLQIIIVVLKKLLNILPLVPYAVLL